MALQKQFKDLEFRIFKDVDQYELKTLAWYQPEREDWPTLMTGTTRTDEGHTRVHVWKALKDDWQHEAQPLHGNNETHWGLMTDDVHRVMSLARCKMGDVYKAFIRDIGMLSEYRYDGIVINTSGGKDSMAAISRVMDVVKVFGYPRNRIILSHQILEKEEWPGTLELCQEHAKHWNLPLYTARYRTKDGEHTTLLDYIKKRGKWPSSTNRYCTSDFKRGPGGRVLTKFAKEQRAKLTIPKGNPVRLLNVYGFRAEESSSRAKKQVLIGNSRQSSGAKTITDWLPVHHWKLNDVWTRLRKDGLQWHPAYDYGMPRLSCCFCIFAPKDALVIAGKKNPELLDEYIAAEQEMGHAFQYSGKTGKWLSEIKDLIEQGYEPDVDTMKTGRWNM